MPLVRQSTRPLLTRRDVPSLVPVLADPTSVFNPGAALDGDDHVLMLRVQSRGRETFRWVARGRPEDGFEFDPGPVAIEGLGAVSGTIHHVYDPRITRLDGRRWFVVAMDLDDRCALGLASGDDLSRLRFEGFVSEEDSRNGVLFPGRPGGRYLLLERPNCPSDRPGEPPGGDEVVLAESEDLRAWRRVGPVMRGRPRSWDERIGSGPPPVLTTEGWLHLYHGIATHFASANVYQVGAVLLDADDPRRVLARTRRNILEPRETWELVGQVPNVVFPGGMVVEGGGADPGLGAAGRPAGPDALLTVYYGAADTCVGVATTTVGQILSECES